MGHRPSFCFPEMEDEVFIAGAIRKKDYTKKASIPIFWTIKSLSHRVLPKLEKYLQVNFPAVMLNLSRTQYLERKQKGSGLQHFYKGFCFNKISFLANYFMRHMRGREESPLPLPLKRNHLFSGHGDFVTKDNKAARNSNLSHSTPNSTG